jgi:hypothetical protein
LDVATQSSKPTRGKRKSNQWWLESPAFTHGENVNPVLIPSSQAPANI